VIAGGPGATGIAAGAGVSPTSAGTGGGRSEASSAGRETIPAIAAAAIADTRPTVGHLICLPVTPI